MSCTRYASMASLRRHLIADAEPEWLKKHPRRSYIVRAVLASPPWVWKNHRAELLALRDEARRKTAETGVEWTLDHIEPLNGKYVCGLQVPWNMRVITRKANMHKSNHNNPNIVDMFSDPEQFKLFMEAA